MEKMWRSGALSLLTACAIGVTVTPAISQSASQHQSTKKTGAQSIEQIWKSLMDGNERFVDGKVASHDVVSQRRSLAKSQHPLVAVLSCSDSRVPPEVIFDQGLGDLFVVRTAGNSADPLGIGSLEYAVEHLRSVVIVVLGHQSCGAVTAACSGDKMTTSNLEAVVEPIAGSCRAGKERHPSEGVVEFAVKDHVHETANAILARSEILKHAHDEGTLTIVEAYYSLDSGTVTRLR
jgi:carbonic anhydrase